MKTIRRALLGALLALFAVTIIGAPAYAANAADGTAAVGPALELPVIPTGAVVLLGFFSTYATAALNGALAWVKRPWQKRAVSVAVSIVLAVVVIVFYYAMTGESLPSWPVFVILSIMIAAASYALVTKSTASKVEASAARSVTASTLRRDLKG